MPKILFVVGLPGSGKSHYLVQIAATGFRPFDDFKANSIGNSSAFTSSRHLDSLVGALREGQDCVVADIDFCRCEARAEAEAAIRQRIVQLDVEWHCFEKDEEQCRFNIHGRRRDSMEAELRKLEEFALRYDVPGGCVTLPVWGRQRSVTNPGLSTSSPGPQAEKKI